jgi:glycosyltransferase involved in cell wall biosynthesis
VTSLSVVVPAWNEEALLERTVRSLALSLSQVAKDAEVVIVDDGSRDRTPALADALAKELPRVRALHQENQGIGGAFRTGMLAAEGEYVVLWPADMLAAPGDLEPYVSSFGKADVVVGVRRRREGYNVLMRANAWLYPKLVAFFFGLRLRDVNWICAYRRARLLEVPLTRRGIAMLAEILIGIRDRGGTFVEVEVAMKPREGGVASASRFRVMRRTLADLLGLAREWRRTHRR